MSATVILTALAVTFVASVVRFSIGFGNALIAVPLLALVMDVKTATPLIGLLTAVTALLMTIIHRRHIDFKATWRLLAASVVGIPLGILFLKGAYETQVKAVLAVAVMLFAAYNLVRPRRLRLESQASAWGFGFAAGLLGGAYTVNGPPIVMYGSLRHWPTDTFRGTLQGYFFPCSLLILAGHGAAGLWTPQVIKLFLICLPAILVSMPIGHRLGRAIPEGRFDQVINGFLVLVAIALLIQAIHIPPA